MKLLRQDILFRLGLEPIATRIRTKYGEANVVPVPN